EASTEVGRGSRCQGDSVQVQAKPAPSREGGKVTKNGRQLESRQEEGEVSKNSNSTIIKAGKKTEAKEYRRHLLKVKIKRNTDRPLTGSREQGGRRELAGLHPQNIGEKLEKKQVSSSCKRAGNTSQCM
uniref:Uncharacterized protein n=1 Tax=Varanus komodoensis TaxID=61221 RepID=A0A8D2JD47_VARKO